MQSPHYQIIVFISLILVSISCDPDKRDGKSTQHTGRTDKIRIGLRFHPAPIHGVFAGIHELFQTPATADQAGGPVH